MSVAQSMLEKVTPGNVWDKNESGSVKGLHLRVLPSGSKAYYFVYTTKSGIQRRPKIGGYTEIDLGEARKRARTLSNRVSVGEDPKGQWDIQRAEKTVSEAFIGTLDGLWSQKRYIQSGRRAEVIRLFKLFPQGVTGQKLSDLTQKDIRVWHTWAEKPILANRALEVLSRVFTYSIEQGWCSQNPCIGVKANIEKKRKRFATPEEIKLIGEKLYEQTKSGDWKSEGALFLLGLLFTGSRPRVLELAEYKSLSRRPEGYAILDAKGKGTAESGENETVILPKQFLDLLDTYPRPKNGRIFGSSWKWRSVWNQIRTEVGCTDLWARDLRRTFATVGLSNGISIGAIGEVLNHKSAQTTKIYAKVFDQVKVETTSQIADRMEEIFNT